MVVIVLAPCIARPSPIMVLTLCSLSQRNILNAFTILVLRKCIAIQELNHMTDWQVCWFCIQSYQIRPLLIKYIANDSLKHTECWYISSRHYHYASIRIHRPPAESNWRQTSLFILKVSVPKPAIGHRRVGAKSSAGTTLTAKLNMVFSKCFFKCLNVFAVKITT